MDKIWTRTKSAKTICKLNSHPSVCQFEVFLQLSAIFQNSCFQNGITLTRNPQQAPSSIFLLLLEVVKEEMQDEGFWADLINLESSLASTGSQGWTLLMKLKPKIMSGNKPLLHKNNSHIRLDSSHSRCHSLFLFWSWQFKLPQEYQQKNLITDFKLDMCYLTPLLKSVAAFHYSVLLPLVWEKDPKNTYSSPCP